MSQAHTDRVHRVFGMDHPYKLREYSKYIEGDVTPDGIICGPKHEDMVDFCQYDTNEYQADPLRSQMIRLSIASAAFAVLRYADYYDAVIGEDCSGRYPALIIGGAINDVRRAHGLDQAQRLFMSGRIAEFATPAWQLAENDQALVVTEYICQGVSTENVAEVLKRQTRQPIDFVTVGGTPELTARRHVHPEVLQSSTVYTGDLRRFGYRVDGNLSFESSQAWKGVQKRNGKPHSYYMPGEYDREPLIRSRLEAKMFQSAISSYYLDVIADGNSAD